MVAVKPYSFHRDPLFWIGCGVYAINRWILKTLSPNPFLHSHFSDLWLVPCVLPLIVTLHRRMGWRDDQGPPTWEEAAVHLMLWSVFFEGVGPHMFPHTTGDPWDVACYAVGGLVAVAWWRSRQFHDVTGATSFDVLAPHYRWMEAITAGPLLQRSRTVFLEDCDDAQRILVLGVGRGRFIAALRERNPRAHITAVDSSARMLAHAQADLAGHGKSITFVHSDVLTWNGEPEAFDMVASHFFLDCFRPDQLVEVAARVASWTRHDARWLVTDFCVPERGWRRWRARGIHTLMYAAFRWATNLAASRLTPPDPILSAAGFTLRSRVHANHGLLHSDVWIRSSA